MHAKNIILVIFVIQLATLFSTFYNVPFARQLFGFVFVTFVPGYLILKLLKFEGLDLWMEIFLSVGASVASLMFLGLLLNTLLPILGFSRPLSTFPIILSINLLVSVSCAILWRRSQSSQSFPVYSLRFLPVTIFLMCIPLLTVLGTEITRISDNTFLLIVLVVATSTLVFCAFSSKLVPEKTYPLVILAIAFFLLFHTSLMSSYVIGYDIHAETYFAQTTFLNSFWDRTTFHPYNAMVSVTILPVIYAVFLNLDTTWVFKIVYPLIYMLVPLILYSTFRKQTHALPAFLATFFFMAIDTFYVQMLGLARQMIGELFFALLILLIIDEKMSVVKKKPIFIFLAAAMLLSHYSLAYLFVFLALVSFAVSNYFRGFDRSHMITGKFIFGYMMATSAWYLFGVPAASKSLADAVGYIYNALISNAFGPGVGGLVPSATSLLRQSHQYLFYLLQLFIIVGVFVLVMNRKNSVFNSEYSGLSIGCLLLLLMSLALPNFAASLNMSRIYHLSLFCLSLFCVLGGLSILRFMTNVKSHLHPVFSRLNEVTLGRTGRVGMFLIAMLLVCLFLFQVGFVYSLSGDNPVSISLSRDRSRWSQYMRLLGAGESEVFGSEWLRQYAKNESGFYGDLNSNHFLTSYGLVFPDPQHTLDPWVQYRVTKDSYFFFGSSAIENNEIVGWGATWNTTAFSPIFNNDNQIYSNGACDIFFQPVV